jgi:hypothetical protein
MEEERTRKNVVFKILSHFHSFWAHFFGLRPKKPGYPGLRFAPAPALAPGLPFGHPSYPLRGSVKPPLAAIAPLK